jgi:hypothetical protein
VIALVAALAGAATYDPELTWRTITTEHFHVHFHQGEEALAERFSGLVEEVYDTMTEELVWAPRRRVELVLVDRTDSANGFAGAVPYNAIVIYVTAPNDDSTLSLYEDWPEAIFTHELTHVLHMDTNHGLVRLARSVVGRVASTNNLSPWWMVEGLATFEETRYTSGGRGRAPLVDMVKRTAVIEHDFPPLGNLDGLQVAVPSGNLRYLFGQDFMQYVADTRGEQVWTRWTHRYGSGIPYVLPSKGAFGREILPMYRDWQTELERRYTEQLAPVEAEGIREGRVLSDPAASCVAPAFSPDGEQIVWSCTDLARGNAIWLADGEGYAPEVELQDRGATNFTWRSDSQAFVYAGMHVVSRFNTWSDVWMHEVGTDGVVALTNAKRARDPEFSPDGSRLVVVTNEVSTNDLQVMTVDRRLEPLTDFGDDTQLSTPRYHPAGQHLAVSMWQQGRRDLWIFDDAGEPVRRLTADAALEMHPRWSADGAWLYFVSDRSGIPNVYALEVATERLFQVTNVRTGALSPSPRPDGSSLVYAQYTHDGFEIRMMDLDPASFLDRGLLPATPDGGPRLADLLPPVAPVAVADVDWTGETPDWRPGDAVGPELGTALAGLERPQDESIQTFDQLDVREVYGEEQDFPFTIPPHRYNPLPTLAPRFAVPWFTSTPFEPTRFAAIPLAFQANLATASSDVLRHYAYQASLSYRNDADFVGGAASVVVNRFLPVYAAGISRVAVPFPAYLADPLQVGPDGVPRLEVAPTPYWERRTTAYAQVSYPYRPQTTIFATYGYTRRQPLHGIPEGAYLPRIPVRGSIGRLSAGWSYAWARPTRLAVSTEDGKILNVVVSALHPWLGTRIEDADGVARGLTQLQATGEYRGYWVPPWRPNHVLAVRAAGGGTLGRTSFLGNYQLGGTFGDGSVNATPDEFRMLRGYPIAADVGDMYWLGSFEYRLPLWRIDRGVGTLPAFARYLSLHAFLDAGNAFTAVQGAGDVVEGALVGTGAELRFATVVGWSTSLTVRLGYGAALTPGGFSIGDPRGAYLRLGGSF